MAENPVFWSSTTVIVDRRNGSPHTLTVDRRTGSPSKLWVDSRNGSLLSEILSSRRMQAVREICIWSRGLSEEGWRNVAEHPGRDIFPTEEGRLELQQLQQYHGVRSRYRETDVEEEEGR